jgi:hypothetical protein
MAFPHHAHERDGTEHAGERKVALTEYNGFGVAAAREAGADRIGSTAAQRAGRGCDGRRPRRCGRDPDGQRDALRRIRQRGGRRSEAASVAAQSATTRSHASVPVEEQVSAAPRCKPASRAASKRAAAASCWRRRPITTEGCRRSPLSPARTATPRRSTTTAFGRMTELTQAGGRGPERRAPLPRWWCDTICPTRRPGRVAARVQNADGASSYVDSITKRSPTWTAGAHGGHAVAKRTPLRRRRPGSRKV